MKKIILFTTLIILSGCGTDLSSYTTVDSNAPIKTKMRACIVNEANSRLQAGTLFNNTITATSKDIVNVCVKKLALESAGITEESQSTAANIITSLQNLNK